MTKDFFIKQLDGIINDFNTIKSKAKYDDLSGSTTKEEILFESSLITMSCFSVG